MSEIWETFDGLFKTVYRQREQVEQLEERVIYLEKLLIERDVREHGAARIEKIKSGFPLERAA